MINISTPLNVNWDAEFSTCLGCGRSAGSSSGGVAIDDSAVSTRTTWSSKKIKSEITAGVQPSTSGECDHSELEASIASLQESVTQLSASVPSDDSLDAKINGRTEKLESEIAAIRKTVSELPTDSYDHTKLENDIEALNQLLANTVTDSELADALGKVIDDSAPTETTTYSSSKVESLIEAIDTECHVIDDSKPSETTTYSSSKIDKKLEAVRKAIPDAGGENYDHSKLTDDIEGLYNGYYPVGERIVYDGFALSNNGTIVTDDDSSLVFVPVRYSQNYIVRFPSTGSYTVALSKSGLCAANEPVYMDYDIDIDDEDLPETLITCDDLDYTHLIVSDTAARVAEVREEPVRFSYNARKLCVKYERLLANVNENVIFNAEKADWDDLPEPAAFVVKVERYSNNYLMQYAFRVSNGVTYHRVVNRTNGTVYRNWSKVLTMGTCAKQKVSILGDSISTYDGYVPTGEGYATWYPKTSVDPDAVDDVNKTWWMQFINQCGMVLHSNASVSGSCCSTGARQDRVSACKQERIDLLAKSGKAPDVIVVYMGTNDFVNGVPLGTWDGSLTLPETDDTFREAYALMLNRIITTYPKARVLCCTLQHTATKSTEYRCVDTYKDVLKADYNEVIRRIARLFNCEVVEFETCGINAANIPYYTQDDASDDDGITGEGTGGRGIHPNTAGHTLLANTIAKHFI